MCFLIAGVGRCRVDGQAPPGQGKVLAQGIARDLLVAYHKQILIIPAPQG